MALKKPSQYFKKEDDNISDGYATIKNIENSAVSSTFESFKNFSNTLDDYSLNIEKINYLSEKVEEIQGEIQGVLKKEHLDRAMLAQLLAVDQSISDVQNRVKAINEVNLNEIRSDVSHLSEVVNEFIETEVPKYKKLVVSSELRTNNRYDELEKNVKQTLDDINEFVDKKYYQLTETISGINEETLSQIYDDFKQLNNNFLLLKEDEIPVYKKFIVETEKKTEFKIDELQEKFNQIVQVLNEKISSVEKNDDILNGKILEIKNIGESVIDGIKNNDEIERKLINFENNVLQELQNNKELNKKVSDLEIDVIRSESHLKTQNKHLERIQEDVYSAIEKLNLDLIQEKSYELTKKIEYLEEVFEKFNQENLTEGLLNEPPEIKTADPLTPTDQKFVTLEQLQEHYRLFINRIQQQLSTIGGSGETRLKYLDDIVGIATNPSVYDGKYLKYNHGVGKFEFGSAWTDTVDDSNDLTYTYSRVAVGTDSIESSPYPGNNLLVYGDARITGVVAIGTASILLDPDSGSIRSGDVQVVSSDGSANYTGVVTAFGFVGLGTTSFFSDLVASNLTLDSALSVGGSLNVSGDLIVEGTTTTIDSVTLTVDDKNIELASSDSPSDVSADGGGITLKGDTDHTIIWSNSNSSWDFSENLNIITGKEYRINDISVLDSTTLGVGVTNSSLTSFGVVPSATILSISNTNINTTGIGTIETLDTTTGTIDNLSSTNINATGVGTFSSIHGDGSNITGILLTQLADIDTSNLSGSSTDYLLIYDPSIPGFKFVNPKTYFGINNDANPDPFIEDYGSF